MMMSSVTLGSVQRSWTAAARIYRQVEVLLCLIPPRSRGRVEAGGTSISLSFNLVGRVGGGLRHESPLKKVQVMQTANKRIISTILQIFDPSRPPETLDGLAPDVSR